MKFEWRLQLSTKPNPQTFQHIYTKQKFACDFFPIVNIFLIFMPCSPKCRNEINSLPLLKLASLFATHAKSVSPIVYLTVFY